jgi:hypothetical protein
VRAPVPQRHRDLDHSKATGVGTAIFDFEPSRASRRFEMRNLAILVVATMLATAYSGADASEKAHRKHAANPPKANSEQRPVENPVTRLPVPADTFRA